jgi:hypothetical protein
MGRRNASAALETLRARLAQESARLMIEHGIADFGLAKRKAADRLAVRAAGSVSAIAKPDSSAQQTFMARPVAR